MHCAGTAGHSTRERALDTVRHATGGPVSAMVNASISQVVLLYSVQPLSFSKTASGTAGARMERRHDWRLRLRRCGHSRASPVTARTSLAHTAAQSCLTHCPAASTVATKPAHKRSLFPISDEKLSFVRGFLLWERRDGRPRRHNDHDRDGTTRRGNVTTRLRRRGGTTAGRTPRRERGRCKPACRQQKAGHGAAARTPAPQAAAPKPYAQRSGMPSTTAKTVLAPRRSSSPACSGAAASPCTLFSARLAPSTTSVPFEEPRSLTSQPS